MHFFSAKPSKDCLVCTQWLCKEPLQFCIFFTHYNWTQEQIDAKLKRTYCMLLPMFEGFAGHIENKAVGSKVISDRTISINCNFLWKTLQPACHLPTPPPPPTTVHHHPSIYHYHFIECCPCFDSPAPIIVCFQPLLPLANLTTDWNGMKPPPPLHPNPYHHTHARCQPAIRSLNRLCFLGRHKPDSKANSHCLKWHRCPGICLTFCLLHKAESMHNPCLINIFPLLPLSHSSIRLPFILVQPDGEKRGTDNVVSTFVVYVNASIICILQINNQQHSIWTSSKHL